MTKDKQNQEKNCCCLSYERGVSPCICNCHSKPSKEELRKKISEVLLALSPREQKILVMRFGLEDGISHTLEELGRVFGVTRERIRQIEAKAMEKVENSQPNQEEKEKCDWYKNAKTNEDGFMATTLPPESRGDWEEEFDGIWEKHNGFTGLEEDLLFEGDILDFIRQKKKEWETLARTEGIEEGIEKAIGVIDKSRTIKERFGKGQAEEEARNQAVVDILSIQTKETKNNE